MVAALLSSLPQWTALYVRPLSQLYVSLTDSRSLLQSLEPGAILTDVKGDPAWQDVL